jgi:hypothetical protein
MFGTRERNHAEKSTSSARVIQFGTELRGFSGSGGVLGDFGTFGMFDIGYSCMFQHHDKPQSAIIVTTTVMAWQCSLVIES